MNKRNFLKLSILAALSFFAPKIYAQSGYFNTYRIVAQNKNYSKAEFEIKGLQNLKTGDRIYIGRKDYGTKFTTDEKEDVYEIREIKKL
jgi:hypothetical protein